MIVKILLKSAGCRRKSVSWTKFPFQYKPTLGFILICIVVGFFFLHFCVCRSKIGARVINDRPRGLGMFPEEKPKPSKEATLAYQQELQQQVRSCNNQFRNGFFILAFLVILLKLNRETKDSVPAACRGLFL